MRLWCSWSITRSAAAFASGALIFLAASGHAPGEPEREEGAVHFEAGRYEEAVRSFEKALGRTPESEIHRRNLAHARAAYGQELFLMGNVRDAGALVDEALLTLPGEAGFHLLRARIFLEEGRHYDAMRHAESALRPGSESPVALELIGDVHYQRGELSSALSFWRRAAAAGSSRAEAKAARADIERAAESSFGRDVSIHFTLQYDGPVADGVSRLVLGEMESLYDDIGEFIGSYPGGDIPVILYSRILYHEITGSPLWAAGSFDGKIRVPVAGLRDQDDVAGLRPVLAHELSHVFMRAVAPRGLPLWLEEGLAEHLEAEYGRPSGDAALAAPFPGTFAALDRRLREGGSGASSAYLAARAAVRYLIGHSGDWSLRRLVERVGSGTPFSDALREETGLSLMELEERLRLSP